jgi:hypothetical protein
VNAGKLTTIIQKKDNHKWLPANNNNYKGDGTKLSLNAPKPEQGNMTFFLITYAFECKDTAFWGISPIFSA